MFDYFWLYAFENDWKKAIEKILLPEYPSSGGRMHKLGGGGGFCSESPDVGGGRTTGLDKQKGAMKKETSKIRGFHDFILFALVWVF